MISITGSKGFIGSALARSLGEHYTYPRNGISELYLFGSPSSDIIYKQNIDFCFEETIMGFLNAVQFCRDNNIKLIYPSSATVYNKATVYARCKACLEEIHLSYGGNILGFRIFAGYGVGEEHKGEYASIIYQFCKIMKQGQRPTIFGDGHQTRDFIYIDDIVKTIISAKDLTGLIDIGTGVNTSFNEIVKIINNNLGTQIEPIYINKPNKYINETPCSNPISNFIDIEEGICRILKSLS